MRIKRYVVLLLVIGLVWWQSKVFSQLLLLLLISATFAYLISPMARWFEHRIHKKHGSLFAFLLTICLLVGIVCVILPLLLSQATRVTESLPALWTSIEEALGKAEENLLGLGVPQSVITSLSMQVSTLSEGLVSNMKDVAMGFVQWVFSFGWVALTPVIAFYFLRDRKLVFSSIERFIPSHIRPLILSIASGSHDMIGQYVKGQMIVSIITGILTAIGLLIAGYPAWLLMGFLMAIFNLIPYFGPFLGAIPIVLLATTQGIGMIIKCILVVIAAQQIEALFISPRILSNAVDLHPVLIVMALFVGGAVGGIVGMVFALPCALFIRVVFLKIIQHRIDQHT